MATGHNASDEIDQFLQSWQYWQDSQVPYGDSSIQPPNIDMEGLFSPAEDWEIPSASQSNDVLATIITECEDRGISRLKLARLISDRILPCFPKQDPQISANFAASGCSLTNASTYDTHLGLDLHPNLIDPQVGSKLLSLPPELLLMICKFVFSTGVGNDGKVHFNRRFQVRRPAQVLRTCKKLYSMCINALYGESHFDFGNESARKRFFLAVGKDNLKSIRKITVSSLENINSTLEKGVDGALPGLVELTLDACANPLRDREKPTGWNRDFKTYRKHCDWIARILAPKGHGKLKKAYQVPNPRANPLALIDLKWWELHNTIRLSTADGQPQCNVSRSYYQHEMMFGLISCRRLKSSLTICWRKPLNTRLTNVSVLGADLLLGP